MTGNRIRLSDFSVRDAIQYSTLPSVLTVSFLSFFFCLSFPVLLSVHLSVCLTTSFTQSLLLSFLLYFCLYSSHFSLLFYLILSARHYHSFCLFFTSSPSLSLSQSLSLSLSLLLDSQNLPRNWLLYFKDFFFFYIHIGKSLAGGNFVSRCKTSENRLRKICFLLHGNC